MPPNITRRQWLQGAAALGLPVMATAQTQDSFPSKPIRIIVPLPAGGTADASVRMLAEKMQAIAKQSVVVDNKPGGVFQIGMQAFTQAPADGHTLIHVSSPMAAAQASLKRLNFDKALVPLSLVGVADGVLAVPAASAFKNAKELIDFARANPGKLNYGSVGPGTSEHLAAVNLARKYNLTMTHVPFKGGPDAIMALAQNEIQIFTTVLPLALQMVQKNLVRVLAVMGDKRSPLLPNVPTLKEEGIDVPNLIFWGGLAAPAGTPRTVVDTLQRHIAAGLAEADLRSRFSAVGMTASSSTPEAFAKLISDDISWMSTAVREANLTFE